MSLFEKSGSKDKEGNKSISKWSMRIADCVSGFPVLLLAFLCSPLTWGAYIWRPPDYPTESSSFRGLGQWGKGREKKKLESTSASDAKVKSSFFCFVKDFFSPFTFLVFLRPLLQCPHRALPSPLLLLLPGQLQLQQEEDLVSPLSLPEPRPRRQRQPQHCEQLRLHHHHRSMLLCPPLRSPLAPSRAPSRWLRRSERVALGSQSSVRVMETEPWVREGAKGASFFFSLATKAR